MARSWPALLILVLLGPACGTKTPSEQAGVDQEITRNILWRFREDQAKRFVDVRVSCEGREIILEGRVSDDGAARAALNIALSHARGGRVVSKLAVRPR